MQSYSQSVLGWGIALRRRAGYFTAGLIAFFVMVGFRAHDGLLGVRGPDPYWTLHWLRDYSNGFVRRGLLGEAFGLLGIDPADYVVLSGVTWLISLALALLLIEAAFRLSRGFGAGEAYLFLLVLAVSPATIGLVAETTGDPLQLLLVAYLLVHWLAFVARPVGPGWAAALFGMFGLIAGLIHEASIFLIFPGIVIAAFVLVRTPAARAAAAAYLLGSVVAVLGAILMSHQAAGLIAGGHIHVGTARMELPGSVFPSFAELLAAENAQNFGRGMAGYVGVATRLVGSLLIPFYLACLVSAVSFSAQTYSSTDRLRVWLTFVIPVLLSAPLYLIAHDWGRFAGYAVMASLILLGLWRTERAPKPNVARAWILGVTLLLACIALPVQALEAYRISGLAVDWRLAASGIFFVVAIAGVYWRFWRSQLGL